MEPQDTPKPPERFWTVGQIARRRNLSSDTVRRIFLEEPGVLVITRHRPHKRVYRSLRIPETVDNRVFARMTNKGR
jgi:hypothetical protein